MADLNAVTAHRLERIQHDKSVSFIELRRILEKYGVSPKGTLAIQVPEFPNTFIWAGMSKEFATVIDQLKQSGSVEIKPSTVLVYMLDGEILDWPIAKRPSHKGYAKPHWFPVVFNPVQ